MEHSIIVQQQQKQDTQLNTAVKVNIVQPDTIILMMGQAAEQFFNPVLKQQQQATTTTITTSTSSSTSVRAVPHSLTMSNTEVAETTRRNW